MTEAEPQRPQTTVEEWGTVNDLDPRDLPSVLHRVVLPVVAALMRPGEVDSLTLTRQAPTGFAFTSDEDPLLWLVLTCGDDHFDFRLCSVFDDELISADVAASDLYPALQDFVAQSGFGWGEERQGDYTVPS